jgi:pimeloyl-ACP methyl ester carboxylesterase
MVTIAQKSTVFPFLLALLISLIGITIKARSQQPTPLFSGEKTSWHEGFDRYDFVMDELTLEVTPYKASPDEKYGAKPAERGKLRCIVVAPKKAAPGNPWSWRGYYWDHEPQTEIELLKRGFHIAWIMSDADRHWDAWYKFLVDHGLDAKPAFIGMSRGGINEFVWGALHPDKVACIYTDNPALRPESFDGLTGLAKHDVPLLHVVGSYDYLLQKYTLPVEDIYHRLGGRISLMIKEGPPHHPHSLRDPMLIAGWMETNYHHSGDLTDSLYAIFPALPTTRFIKSYYYSFENKYIAILPESTYAVCRGPLFTDTYTRYDAYTPNWLGLTGMTILVPKQPAPGNPWVFKADRIGQDAEPVDLALLAKGFYIVAAPVTEQPGPIAKQWDELYQLLTSHGFSARPVMEGRGAGGGEAYYWAINNPGKVACIYAENPVLRSLQTKTPLTDTLAPLAAAHIPILHVCGSLDPWYPANTKETQKKYRQLGGAMKVILKEGAGHFELIQDPTPIVEFITSNQH